MHAIRFAKLHGTSAQTNRGRMNWIKNISSALFRRRYDIALITDLRFPGGTGSSNATEIDVQHEAGLRTALFHAPSPQIPSKRVYFSAKITACLNNGKADLRPNFAKTYAPLTIIRHPTVANTRRFLPTNLKTDRVIVVINHPALRGNGVVDYELTDVVANVKATLGHVPELRANSPLVEAHCRGPRSQDVVLGDLWPNVFRIPARRTRHPSQPFVIGRHSRDNLEKWPHTAETIRQAYPNADGISIKILGGASVPARILGSLPPNWEVLEFDPFGQEAFLQSIDVYVYFHHRDWVEAFGRAPCEAILAGVPTILPRSFEPLFKSAALYCEPDEVLSLVKKLQDDPEFYARRGEEGRAELISKFGADRHIERLVDAGVLRPNTSMPPLVSMPAAGLQ